MDLLAELTRARVMAIIRAADTSRFGEVVDVLVDSDINVVELPLTTPGVLDALRSFAARDDVLLGAGTVLTADDATAAIAAGARYLVTPALCPDVATAAGELGVPVVMGVFTPSEIVAAMRAGATAVKLFPASTVGPDYVAAIRQPLPDLPLVVVGGVRVEDAAAYLRAGALAVGVGSPLLGDACAGGSLDELRQRARALVAEARGVFA